MALNDPKVLNVKIEDLARSLRAQARQTGRSIVSTRATSQIVEEGAIAVQNGQEQWEGEVTLSPPYR